MAHPLFVVGCPRSGTTYVQSLIARLGPVLCLPETQFFVELYGAKNRHKHSSSYSVYRRMASRFGLVNPKYTAKRMKKLSGALSVDYKSKSWLKDRQVIGLRHSLDQYCNENNYSCWSEKSPNHVFYIDEICKSFGDAKFIHVVRDGADVVSSIYDAMERNASWSGRYESIKVIAEVWNSAVENSSLCVGKSNHMFVNYQNIKGNEEKIVSSIASFLGVEDDEVDEAELIRRRSMLVYEDEVWKSGLSQGSSFSAENKFDQIFSKVDRRRIGEYLINGGNVVSIFANEDAEWF